MNIVEIIEKKKNKIELTKEEITFAVNGFLDDSIKDYQMSALLMAICSNSMTDEEIFHLTDAMVKSGDIIDLSTVPGVKIDKHSTGGIGDKVTLVLAPLVASTGVIVPKMSGRGLGFTGGTIDKLESIEGFKVDLTKEEFLEQLKKVNMVVASQTENIALADKKIYALRSVTGTVESIPLIATSIMSKKIASGANKLVIDVKVGNGALMKTQEEARELANIMIKIGKNYNIETICILTDMNQPLGNSIGNGLEVLESIDILTGKGSKEIVEFINTFASLMVSMAKDIS
ncbi:MAG: thymidine phosphorylase, partial [Bacilli bacterium]|nr:thymidine phosphorylase [Bacilli bacterium]